MEKSKVKELLMKAIRSKVAKRRRTVKVSLRYRGKGRR